MPLGPQLSPEVGGSTVFLSFSFVHGAWEAVSTHLKADLDDDLRNRFAFSLRLCGASFLSCSFLQAGL